MCISFVLAGNAMADTITVDLSGNGDYTSIQDAINNSDSGDSIIVKSGTYTENLLVNKSISIQSESGNPDNTVIMAADQEDDEIHVTADNVTICGFNITRENAPIVEDYSYHYSGIFVDSAENILIENNSLSNNCLGIFLEYSNDNILTNNTMCYIDTSIKIYESSRNTVINNNVFFSLVGIGVSSGGHNTLTNNSIEYCDYRGIDIRSERYTATTGNSISFCDKGIRVIVADNSTFTDNTIVSNNCSFDLYYLDYVTISDNNASNNAHNGLYMYDCRYSTIKNNIISNNSEFGMFIDSFSNFNLIYNNYLSNTNNANCVCSNTWNITKIAGTNIVGGPYLGGNFWASTNGTGFSQINADNNKDGICDTEYAIGGKSIDKLPLSSYQSSTIIVDCGGSGDYTSIQDAINNSTSGNSIVVKSGTYTENILIDKPLSIASDSGNPDTVTIKPIDNQSYTIFVNSDDVVLKGFTVTGADSSKAVFLYESSGCLIENNVVESNKYGIYLNNSDNNEVINNTLKSNDYIGLCLFESDDNIISQTSSTNDLISLDLVRSCNNNIHDNIITDNEVYGIYLHEKSNNNSFSNNSITCTSPNEMQSTSVGSLSMNSPSKEIHNEFELITEEIYPNENDNTSLIYNSNTLINTKAATTSGLGFFLYQNNTGNIIEGNFIETSYKGIVIYNGSSGNTIYNNYLNNTVNLYQYSNETNIWNIEKTAGKNIVGGPYLGGNCWTNPLGTGFSQTHLDMDEDGICDEKHTINEYNVDYLPLFIDEETNCTKSTIYTGPNLHDIIQKYGIYELDSKTNTALKCLEFNSTNFEAFSYNQDDNSSTEILRIYDDGNLTGRTIPENSLEYKTTIDLVDFNASFEDYPYNGYPVINLFGDRYVSLSADSSDMLVKLLKDSNETITLKEGESIDLGSGYTFEVWEINASGERAELEFWRLDNSGNGEGCGIIIDIDENGTTWWCEWDDLASVDNLIVFGVHIKSSNCSSITIDGLWAIDFGSTLVINPGDEFGNLVVDSIDSGSISMRNADPIKLENGTDVRIVNDLSFEVEDDENLSFCLIKEGMNKSNINYAPKASIISISPHMAVEGDEIDFEGSGFDWDGTVAGYNWTSSIDGHLSNSESFSTSDLAVGTHTIYFSVQDNEGTWSDTETTNIAISREISPSNDSAMNITFESQLGGFINDIEISGNYAYVVQGSSFVVLNISNSSNILESGKIMTTSEMNNIDVSGNYAYVASHYNGLIIIDITNPLSPQIVGNYDPGYVYDVDVSGNYAYLATGNNGLVIVDISDPTFPLYKSNYYGCGYTETVFVSNKHAYMGMTGDKLVIVNIDNVTLPTFAGQCTLDNYISDISVSDNYAYVAVHNQGLTIVNISNSSLPSIIGSYNTTCGVPHINVSENYVYFVDDSNSLDIINISNPASPMLESSYEGYFYEISANDNFAYLTNWENGLVVIDLNNPKSPGFAGQYDTTTYAEQITAFENYVYIEDSDGFKIVDVQNATNPLFKSSSNEVYSYNEVAINENYAYVADGYYGLRIMNITIPTSPSTIGRYNTAGRAYDIDIMDDYAYIADYNNGICIVNISDPTNPKLVSNYDIGECIRDITVSGNYAYLGAGDEGLIIIDISCPTNPSFVGSLSSVGYVMDIAVSGNYAYVANHEDYGLVIVNISNHSSPFIANHCKSISRESYSVSISGHYVYVAAGNDGVYVLDISDPTSPLIAGIYDSRFVLDIDIFEDYIYVADTLNGLIILHTEIPSESNTSPTTTTTSSGGSSGGGGGGGTSGELYENIAFKDVKSEFVTKDSGTKYDFDNENNEVEFIQFTASRNWGKISATIEYLHDTSALVDKEPEGTVYRNLNIWVGKSGFSDSDNIKDCVIGFKVSRQWLEENDIDEGSIRLLHYSEGEWEKLDTKLTDESDEYLHFEAETSGFSPFAIVGDSEEKSLDSDETKMSTDSVESNDAVGKETTEPVNNTPAFESITAIAAFVLAVCCISLRKRERS